MRSELNTTHMELWYKMMQITSIITFYIQGERKEDKMQISRSQVKTPAK